MKYTDIGLMNGKLWPLANLEDRVCIMDIFREIKLRLSGVPDIAVSSLASSSKKRKKDLKDRVAISLTVSKDLEGVCTRFRLQFNMHLQCLCKIHVESFFPARFLFFSTIPLIHSSLLILEFAISRCFTLNHRLNLLIRFPCISAWCLVYDLLISYFQLLNELNTLVSFLNL